ncbi:hypothetical protein KI659_17710 [Litoribacter alkaliphilus]|uniref:Uncharacterized protein n=1 Tax=Litoribacter ruber TaxID=702568 RepID=A0AAP2G2J7_9BACT|nr:hypothetical protein [Litoribacter alkaliphilus]MBS9525862.1 hypothetical protein [Litoribacter alkaliphilus]
MQKSGLISSIDFLVPLPATILGVLVMRYYEVPVHLWLLNLVFVCLGIIMAVYFHKKPNLTTNIHPVMVIAVTILLLLCTFLDNGIMNVHRWINLNSFQLNIGLIVSPLILIQLSRINNRTLALALSMLITLIFLFQPDASLVSAFSISGYFLLYRKFKHINLLFLLCCLIMIGYAWYNLDNLEPVRYVENILALAKEISMGFYVLSIGSLLLLLLPFLFKRNDLSVTLAIYYSILLIATIFGHFPVMLMGYGISPIIGYFIGLVWQTSSNSSVKLIKAP